jgi:hypothetical protein
MHYILPAADAAQELQEALHAYLKQHDNPLVKKNAQQLGAVNLQTTLAQQATYLMARLQHYKFCLSVLARRERDPAKLELITQLWDHMERFRPYTRAQFETFTTANLEMWVADLRATVEKAEKHIRVSEATKRRLGMVPLDQDIPVFTIKDCRRVIEAILLDELISQLHWLPRAVGETQTNLQRAMLQLFPDWDGLDAEQVRHLPKEHIEVWQEQALKCSIHLYRKVLEPMTLRISRWVANAIPERTWDMWIIRPLGQDLVLEKGEDFRVWDWTRRMENKEWSLDDVRPQFLDPEHEEVSAQTFEDVRKTQQRTQALDSLGLSVELFPTTLGTGKAPQLIQSGQKPKSQRKSRA